MSATRPSGRGSLVSPGTRARVRTLAEPVALFLGRLGLTPNGLTLIGFAITVVGAILLGLQQWLIGGIVVFLGGVFDMFDGTLARATGKVSNLGAFMDSVFDRWGEALVYVGVAAGLAQAGGNAAGPVLAAAAMGSAFMVSYTRARSEGLGFTTGTGMAAVGLMPREVRLIVLSLGLILAGISGTGGGAGLGAGAGAVPVGIVILQLALGIIALGATITVIQRILHVRQQAVASDGK
ncbi:MAG: CDP-diacylglycerol---glycerol-3-phosphate 3-phosphatidyltransferase [Chloroflexota bacterium]|jgi:CDP-diacylglycerol--glycerol-3-phosphate 3-phosphatidyltransferase|nr:CDP-diacylglycerol---glycerol-3-phosphate 3-phosphatidyltransferase [Chloroflexota bacterium]